MNGRIFSPMTEGNGAIVAHRYLESGIPSYRVRAVHPVTALLGPGLKLALPVPADIGLIHSVPDLACFFQRPGLPSVVSLLSDDPTDPDTAEIESYLEIARHH